MRALVRYAAAGLAAVVLAGCASSVKRDAAYGEPAQPMPVSNVTVGVSPAGQKAAAENTKFEPQQLASTVRRALETNGVLRPGTGATAEIVVNDVRIRGTASAILLGAMAGSDHITGDVIVRNSAGQVLRKFTVAASYSLGGFAGGIDDTRIGWLYDKFAEHTVAELRGGK